MNDEALTLVIKVLERHDALLKGIYVWVVALTVIWIIGLFWKRNDD